MQKGVMGWCVTLRGGGHGVRAKRMRMPLGQALSGHNLMHWSCTHVFDCDPEQDGGIVCMLCADVRIHEHTHDCICECTHAVP